MTHQQTFNADTDPRTLEQIVGKLRGLQLYMVHMDVKQHIENPFEFFGAVLREHVLWLEHQEQTGVMFLCGQNRTEDAWDGSGTLIIRAESLTHACEIASAEPFHREGLRYNTVHGWVLNEGSLQIKVRLFADNFDVS